MHLDSFLIVLFLLSLKCFFLNWKEAADCKFSWTYFVTSSKEQQPNKCWFFKVKQVFRFLIRERSYELLRLLNTGIVVISFYL